MRKMSIVLFVAAAMGAGCDGDRAVEGSLDTADAAPDETPKQHMSTIDSDVSHDTGMATDDAGRIEGEAIKWSPSVFDKVLGAQNAVLFSVDPRITPVDFNTRIDIYRAKNHESSVEITPLGQNRYRLSFDIPESSMSTLVRITLHVLGDEGIERTGTICLMAGVPQEPLIDGLDPNVDYFGFDHTGCDIKRYYKEQ